MLLLLFISGTLLQLAPPPS